MAFWPLLLSFVTLIALSRLEAGGAVTLAMFERIEPELERLQRLALPWNWVSTWGGYWYRHYLILGVVCLVAFLRLLIGCRGVR